MIIPFRPIARLLARTLHPAPTIDIASAQPLLAQISQGQLKSGVLLTANHFSAPDFSSWWFVILISSIIPQHVHWVVSAGWTNSGWLTNFTHWLFPIGARILDFTSMPAMPPDPGEMEKRAEAVRHLLAYAHRATHPLIGFTPEGRDIPGGVLGNLPPGVGRFMHLIFQYCPNILPVGVWKDSKTIQIKFGCPYSFEVPQGLSHDDRDRLVGFTVMQHIAHLIPDRLRGDYG